MTASKNQKQTLKEKSFFNLKIGNCKNAIHVILLSVSQGVIDKEFILLKQESSGIPYNRYKKKEHKSA